MDFIEGLPHSGKYDVILLVVDKFTKYVQFIPLVHPFTAPQLATSYLDTVYKLHGLPEVIVFGCDCIFKSSFWQHIFKATDTKLHMSSSYHPQIDGQSEKLNQCLETYLRCCIHSCPTKWARWLPLMEYCYNTNYHSVLGRTPFEVLYRHLPRHFGIPGAKTAAIPDIEAWLANHHHLNTFFHQQLLHAQARMKTQANKCRTERTFSVGDMIYSLVGKTL